VEAGRAAQIIRRDVEGVKRNVERAAIKVGTLRHCGENITENWM
jgi:hypothetical protein